METKQVKDTIEMLDDPAFIKRFELSKTERQKVNQQKAIFKDRLLNADDITTAIKLFIRSYAEYENVVIENGTINAKYKLENAKQYLDGETVNPYDPTSDEYKEIEKQTNKEYWQLVCMENKEYFSGLLNGARINEELGDEDYKKLIEFVTENTDQTIDGKQRNRKTINRLNRKYKELLNRISPVFLIALQLYLKDTKENSRYITQTSIYSMLAGELERAPSKIEVNNFLFDRGYKAPTGKSFAYAYALAEIVGNCATIKKGVIDATSETGKDQNEIIPRLYYDEVMQISHSRYITALVENGFKLNESVFNESEDTLNSLETEDNDILDLLVLNWYAHGVRRFTDRQVAVALYHGGNSNADVSKKELQKINESIERLRRTEIKQGVESNADIGDTKLKYTQRPFLISVLPQDIEHAGDTTVYDFTGLQGYEEYALITKRTSKYNNALITADIKGIQHDFKNDTLKRLLVRRIAGLEHNKHTAIDMREVYEVLEIADPRNYTYAKKKVETIIKELRNDENDIYYNFGYEFKKRNKATILTFTASTKNPLQVDKTKKE